MDDAHGAGRKGSSAEDLILRTIAAHADSLLRTARRFSLCPDDAQDAYQRALEIFMAHAERLDPDRAPRWLHVVVRREAQAIRRSRRKLVASDEVNFDDHEARSLPTPDEQLATFDMIGRSAEALQRLKPQELRALWLRALGHSYNDIAAMTGWSYTKVNRCLTEGRRSFLQRYATIQSGAECDQWLPVISAFVDGEASREQVTDLRPHLRNCPACRATLKVLRESSERLPAILPGGLLTSAASADDHVASLFTRAYEVVVGGLHDRAVQSLVKGQGLLEAASTGKVAAVAASAAAVAGGGYVTTERPLPVAGHKPAKQSAIRKKQRLAPQRVSYVRPQPRLEPSRAVERTVNPRPQKKPNEFVAPRRQSAPEFVPPPTPPAQFSRAAVSEAGITTETSSTTSSATSAPEFARSRSPAPEFAP